MGFDWENYREFAEWLNNQTCVSFPEAIKCRNVISRAYYSSLHETNEFYYDVFEFYPPRDPEKETTHKALLNKFKDDIGDHFKDESLLDILEDIIDKLNEFRGLRNDADYREPPGTTMDRLAVNEAFTYCGYISKWIRNIRDIYGV